MADVKRAAKQTIQSLKERAEHVAGGPARWMSTWLAPGDTGLELTFLIMLVPVLAASLLAIPARLAYPRDVLTADASANAVPAR